MTRALGLGCRPGVTADAGGHLNDDGTWVPEITVAWDAPANGYIASGAALLAMALEPRMKDFLLWSHRSAEPGAKRLLERLGIEPVLDLGLRLGEGTGAALSVPILRSACAVMREMATFGSAGVLKG